MYLMLVFSLSGLEGERPARLTRGEADRDTYRRSAVPRECPLCCCVNIRPTLLFVQLISLGELSLVLASFQEDSQLTHLCNKSSPAYGYDSFLEFCQAGLWDFLWSGFSNSLTVSIVAILLCYVSVVVVFDCKPVILSRSALLGEVDSLLSNLFFSLFSWC